MASAIYLRIFGVFVPKKGQKQEILQKMRKKLRKKLRKNLQIKKYGVPLHSQSKNIAHVNFKCTAEIAQLVEHNLAKVGVASSSLVFRSKSKSFEDKIKQNPLKQCFRGFFICCRSVSLRHRGASTRHNPNIEVSLRILTVKLRDTYSEMRGHFENFSAFHKLFRLTVAYALIKTVR